MTREMNFTIREKDAGRAVGAFLAARFTYHSVSEWAALLGEGRVRVNGSKAEPEAPLRCGDVVTYDASGIPEPPVDERVEVLVDDPLVLAVNKSGNLPCHPGGRYFSHTLWAIVKERLGVREPVLVNRIDRETSGLVLIAKTPEAAQNLWKQFARHVVQKRYDVLVEGVFPERAEAAGWLVADRKSAIRKKRRFAVATAGGEPPEPGAEWAETAFERVRVCDGFSAVRAIPRTGRLHQIRATLLALGFPVVGDKLYGVDETLFLRFCSDTLTEEDRRRLRLGRQALHATWLRFHHPRFGKLIELEAPLPDDMAALLRSDRPEKAE
jgi:23S rRNA pseudouridine955/2504/2580 synthase/23S rRNA pseudouridine1911/1915/1917 synthase